MPQKRLSRRASIRIFGLCLAWIAFVHVTFFVTLEDAATVWIWPLRGTPAIYPAVALLFGQYWLLAAGLLVGMRLLPGWIRSSALVGLLEGLLVGLWLNTQLLAIPYGGAYTSLPALILASVLAGRSSLGACPIHGIVYWCC